VPVNRGKESRRTNPSRNRIGIKNRKSGLFGLISGVKADSSIPDPSVRHILASKVRQGDRCKKKKVWGEEPDVRKGTLSQKNKSMKIYPFEDLMMRKQPAGKVAASGFNCAKERSQTDSWGNGRGSR